MAPRTKSPASQSNKEEKMAITEFQEKVYAHLLAIPSGRVSTYGTLAKSLSSSPRAVGGALRNNPYAPIVPCHRVIASDGYVGGFKGDWEKAPSGVNQNLKLKLLKEEGVEFTKDGKLVDENVWFTDSFDVEMGRERLNEVMERHQAEK